MADSKTGKKAAAAAAVKVEKVVLSDQERVRLLRIEVASNIYPSSENSRALLREYDNVLAANKKFVDDIRELTDYLVAHRYDGPNEGESIIQMATRTLATTDASLIELDKTSTKLEAARDAAETYVAELRDRVAELEAELENIKCGPQAEPSVPGVENTLVGGELTLLGEVDLSEKEDFIVEHYGLDRPRERDDS
jgi:hypothetical protein